MKRLTFTLGYFVLFSLFIGAYGQVINLSQNLRAYWKFDETSGTHVADNKGVLNGNVTGSPIFFKGVDGNAIGFNKNSSAGITIPNSDSIDFDSTECFSISMLEKNDPISNQSELFLLIKGTTNGIGKWYDLAFKNTLLRFDVDDNIVKSTVSYPLPYDYDTKKWHHIVGVRDRKTDTLYLYLDGVMVASVNDLTENSIKSRLPLNMTNYSLGVSSAIDDVRIYNKALSGNEVKALYNTYTMPAPSSDASITKLAVDEFNFVEGPFNPSLHAYTVNVPQNRSWLTIATSTTDFFAKVTGDGTITTIPGTATVTVTSEDGTTVNTNTIQIRTAASGINLNKANSFHVFPNPATKNSTIEIPDCFIGEEIKLFDSTGKLICSQVSTINKYILDLSGCKRGIYFIKINNETQPVIIY